MKTKPDPEVFLKAAEMLGLNPSDCIVMEGAKSGIEAARKGGMDSIAIGDAIPDGLSDYKVKCFGEILKIVQQKIRLLFDGLFFWEEFGLKNRVVYKG